MPRQLQSLLRNATHAQHAAINRHAFIEGLTRPGFPLENYLALLRSYAALYRAAEPAIEQWLVSESSSFSYSRRRKLPWLIEDLAYFGTSPSPALYSAPVINSWGGLVGMLYGIEGSTLGGQVISRSLRVNLGIEKQSGGRFFFSYGEATRLMWDEFLSFAATVATDQKTLSEAQQASQACFAMFERALDDAQSQVEESSSGLA